MIEEILKWLGLWEEGYNEVALSFEGGLGTGQSIAIGLLALLILWYSWQGSQRLAQRSRRLLLLTLRLIAIALVILIFTQPALALLNVIPIKTRVLILVDTSLSMSLPVTAGGPSRISSVTKALGELDVGGLRETFDLEIYGFDSGLRPMDASILNRAKEPASMGRGTDIMAALKDAAAYTPETISSILLFSDGSDNATFAGDDEDKLDEVKAELADLRVPVISIAAASREKLKDLAIEDVSHGDYGFIRNALDIEVTLKARGVNDVTVPITLKQGGKVLAIASVKLEGKDREVVGAKLSFVPDRVGKYLYTISVPVFEGEAIVSNNTRQFTMKILRDKVRVLHVTGSPSWDVRFMREFLKEEPTVDLISFYILREVMDRTFSTQDELSLIPFPVNRLFDINRELKTFDLVIFQNFESDIYLTNPRYLENIRDYVTEEGGGFMMLGGGRSFSSGRYQESPVAEILPVGLAAEQPFIEGEFRSFLTPDGERHPITSLSVSDDAAENAAIWEALPELEGFNLNMGLKADAIALAVHPHEAVLGENLPVISVREIGRGRTMAITTDTLWRWSFIQTGKGGTSNEYVTFVRNSIRWLTGDPEHRRVAVSVDKSTYQAGETVEARIRALDRNYRPLEDAEIELKIIDSEGNEKDIETFPEDDAFRASFVPDRDGGYILKTKAFSKGREIGHDQVPFTVEYSAIEFKDPWPDTALMENIAKATGGKFYMLPKIPKPSDIPVKKAQKIAGKKPIPLWDTLPALLLIAGVFCTEWYLRKRWGLY